MPGRRSFPRSARTGRPGLPRPRSWSSARAAWAARCCSIWPVPASAASPSSITTWSRRPTSTASRSTAMADIGKPKAQVARRGAAPLQSGRRDRCRRRAADAAERRGPRGRRRSRDRCGRQLCRELHPERRLPRGGQAAGQRLGDRHSPAMPAPSAAAGRATARSFPDVPAEGGTCATVGVLGTAVAVLGSLQAHLALHLLLGLAADVLGRVVTFDAQAPGLRWLRLCRQPRSPDDRVPFIAPDAVTADDLVVDLRSLEEAPESPFAGARRVGVEAWMVLTQPRHRGALSSVAVVASVPLRPLTGFARGSWSTWRWWPWVNPEASA